MSKAKEFIYDQVINSDCGREIALKSWQECPECGQRPVRHVEWEVMRWTEDDETYEFEASADECPACWHRWNVIEPGPVDL